MAKLVVTSRSRELAGTAARLVRHLIQGARVRRSPFRGVLVVEVEGDVLELAQAVNRKCARCTGRDRPRVDLTEPDVKLIAEVMGPRTAVGIVRKAWRPQEGGVAATRA